MGKRTIILLVLALVLVVGIAKVLLFSSSKTSLSNPSAGQETRMLETIPSETLKTYSDPSGFSFNYPDNLSLTTNELTDATYAEVQLSAKGVEGSLNLKITDSKFKTLEEWTKSIKDIEGTPKEAKLGSLSALEVKTPQGIRLASIDQGVLFSIDVSNSQNNFWNKVYSKLLADFSFAPPASADSSSDDISFEGEEIVE